MDFSLTALFLVAAAIAGMVAKLLKQPLLIGYLFAGIFLATTGFVSDIETLDGFAKIGVTLLLFLLGLEMNIREIPSIGKVALVTGIGQILFTSVIGFILASLLGFSTLPAVYIAVALTFSSTIIMVKLLSEKKDLSSLYGKIAIGFLLVQDFVAVIILMFLASVGTEGAGISQYGFVALKAVALFAGIWALQKKVLPMIFDKLVATSTELLSVVSIAWALGIASFVAGPMGFSLEIGGFLAGIALSNLPEHFQIASRTKPLRDFFLVIFFLLLGTQLVIGQEIFEILPSAILLSLFVLIGNPIIVLILMGLSGYKKRTSFMAGLTVAQISEFSFILMNMGRSLGHVTESQVALVVVVGVITMTTSTYLILGAERVFSVIHKYLSIFEKKMTKEAVLLTEVTHTNHIVVVGSGETGKALTKYLIKKGHDVVVVDFNPHVFTKLTAEGITVVFGDVNDPEVAAAAKISDARLIISTTNNMASNRVLAEYLKRLGSKTTVFTTPLVSDALSLYEAGVTYVVVPEVLAGEHIRHIISVYGTSKKKLAKLGRLNFNRLVYK